MIVSQCDNCKHYRGEGKCEAFPSEIPRELIYNERSHQLPFPGDHGIRFEPVDEFAAEVFSDTSAFSASSDEIHR